MLAPLSWIREYVDAPDGKELAEKMTGAGLEVASVTQRGINLKNIVAAEVIEIEEYDKLNKCRVNCGEHGILQCVTTDKNVIGGDIVAYALPGAVIAGGTIVTQRVIKNIESFGMMLSTVELGLTETAANIWRINDRTLKSGENLISKLHLDDTVIEFEITPNRADCLSIIGLAYQIAAVYGKKVKLPEIKISDSKELIIDGKIKISIQNLKGCPKYTGKYIENIKIKPAEALIQARIYMSGMRPISNLVDITNYVMLELGQPLHAFDYNLIRGKEIIVRSAEAGEKIKTIDGQERICSSENLLIADKSGGIAVAGVMGGFESEVTDTTVCSLLESAYFNPVSVRVSSKKIGLSSESSYRFERGIDYSRVEMSSNRAVELLARSCPEIKYSAIKTVEDRPFEKKEIKLFYSNIKRILGTEIEKNKVREIGEAFGFIISAETGDSISFLIPFHRVDIEREIDVIEEIAVAYGYDNIPEMSPETKLSGGYLSGKQKFLKDIISVFVNLGFNEAINYSFTDPDIIKDFSIDYDESKLVKIGNPLGKEISVMRTSVIQSLVKTLQNNVKYRNSGNNFVEIGKKYVKKIDGNALPDETNCLSFVLTEKTILSCFDDKPCAIDFFYAKGLLNAGLKKFNIKTDFTAAKIDFMQPGQTAEIYFRNVNIGIFGKLHPVLAKKYDLPENTFLCELNLDGLYNNFDAKPAYSEFSRFPYTVRDMSLLIPKTVQYSELVKNVKQLNLSILENIQIGSIYEGDEINKEFRAALIKFTYRAKDKTLVDNEIETAHKNIFEMLTDKFGITPR